MHQSHLEIHVSSDGVFINNDIQRENSIWYNEKKSNDEDKTAATEEEIDSEAAKDQQEHLHLWPYINF